MRMASVILIMFVCFPLTAVDEEEILRWINGCRESEGLNPLTEETFLVSSARSYASELQERGILTHRDRFGQGPRDRYVVFGGSALAAGEILGTCAGDAPFDELAEAWWTSDTHREQIMNTRWTCIGIGMEEKEGVLIACVEFSSSLLTDSRLIWRDDRAEFCFVPVPETAQLIFTDSISGGQDVWRRGEETILSLEKDRFPLLWEVRNPDDPIPQRGNRLILTRETDRAASEPPRRSSPGEPPGRD